MHEVSHMRNCRRYVAVSTARLCKFFCILALSILSGTDYGLQAASVALPKLNLKLMEPQKSTERLTVIAHQPFAINVYFPSSKRIRQDAQLRFFIHLGSEVHDFDIEANDIAIEVRKDAASWVLIPAEPIDGGAMSTIDLAEIGHDEKHQHASFAIQNESGVLWQLRITAHKPGVYQLVAAVSPDNGNTHLAEPSFITVEVL